VAERRDHAVDERLAADQAELGMAGGLPGQVLAAAEADLEPPAGARRREQPGKIERRGRGQADRQAGQDLVEQSLLGGAQRPAAAPAVDAVAEGARLGRAAQVRRTRCAAARPDRCAPS
jgi:hypothetical protein